MNSTTYQELLSESIAEIVSGLSKSMAPYLGNIKTPEFSGEKSQDALEWLDSFEQATLGLNDDQKKLLLRGSLTKSARAWYKDEIEPVVQDLDWKSLRVKVLRRYKPSRQAHYLEQLHALKYDEQNDLAGYVDQRIYTLRKAYPRFNDEELIQDTLYALPGHVRSSLNLMIDTDSLKSVAELKSLCLRYDRKVESRDTINNPPGLDPRAFDLIIQNAVNKAVTKLTISSQAPVLAASRLQPVGPDNTRPPVARHPQHYANNRRSFLEAKTNHDMDQNAGSDQQPVDGLHNQNIIQGRRPYTRRPPPSPCYFCQGNHWNADCPKRNLNVNGC